MKSLKYEDNIGLVHLLTKKIFGRIQAMNIGMEYEDLFQDLSLQYINAANGFDEEKGFTFSSYFSKAAFHWADKLIEREKRYFIDVKAMSLSGFGDETQEDHFLEIADDSVSPETEAAAAEHLEITYAKLSPVARKVVDMALGDSPILDAELEAQKQKVKLALDLGTRKRTRETMTRAEAALMLYGRLMNLSPLSQSRIKTEIQPFVELS